MKAEYTVRVVTFQEGEWHVAQCLEWDLATQARTKEDLHYEVQRLLIAQVDAAKRTGREPFENLPAAPLRYHRMWASAVEELEAKMPLADVPAELLADVPAELLLRNARA